MNPLSFLRQLVDLIDAASKEPEQDQNNGDQSSVTVPMPNADHFEDPIADQLMVPPLQQKIELMKKIAGVDSIYDENCETCQQKPCTCKKEVGVQEVGDPQDSEEGEEQELDTLKRNAGLVVSLENDFPE